MEDDNKLDIPLQECSICLTPIDSSSKTLPCKHSFHKECLKYVRKKECPVCRHGF